VHQRKMLIAGLKEHLITSKVVSAERNNTERTADELSVTAKKVTIQSNCGESLSAEQVQLIYPVRVGKVKATTAPNAKEEVAESSEPNFTIRSRASINSLCTPTRSSPENEEGVEFLSSIVKHCQSAKSKLTPMRKDRDAAINTTSTLETEHHGDEERGSQGTNESSKPSVPKEARNRCERMLSSCSQVLSKTFAVIRPSGNNLRHEARQKARALETKAKQMVGKVMSTMRITIKCVVETQQEQMLAFLSLAISMVSNIYPTVPRCNTGLTAMILFYSSLKVSSEYVNDTKAPCFHVTDMTFFIRTKSRGNKTRSSIILLYRYTYSPRDWT